MVCQKLSFLHCPKVKATGYCCLTETYVSSSPLLQWQLWHPDRYVPTDSGLADTPTALVFCLGRYALKEDGRGGVTMPMSRKGQRSI